MPIPRKGGFYKSVCVFVCFFLAMKPKTLSWMFRECNRAVRPITITLHKRFKSATVDLVTLTKGLQVRTLFFRTKDALHARSKKHGAKGLPTLQEGVLLSTTEGIINTALHELSQGNLPPSNWQHLHVYDPRRL